MKEISKVSLTVDEAVAMFGIPKGTLNNLRSAKKGPRYYKVGKRILYIVLTIFRSGFFQILFSQRIASKIDYQ